MSRVLVTGGTGAIGTAVVRRLLRDPDFEVRVSDHRPAPRWMREGAEMHTGDLRVPAEARTAMRGCARVIHVAAVADERPFTLLDASLRLHATVVRAAAEAEVDRCTFVGDDVSGRPESPRAFSSRAGEVLCHAGQAEHGLRYTICRPRGVYGPGVDGLVADLLRAARRGEALAADSDAPVPFVYVDDVADAIVHATAAGEGLCKTYELSAAKPLRAVAEACWTACGNDPDALTLTTPSAEVTESPEAITPDNLRGWRKVTPAEGLARTLASLDHVPGGH